MYIVTYYGSIFVLTLIRCNLYIKSLLYYIYISFTFSHLSEAFIQSDLQLRTIEAIKINKRAMQVSVSLTQYT